MEIEDLLESGDYYRQAEEFMQNVNLLGTEDVPEGITVNASDLTNDLLNFLPRASDDFKKQGLHEEADVMRVADESLNRKNPGQRNISVTISGGEEIARWQVFARINDLAKGYRTFERKLSYLTSEQSIFRKFNFRD